MKLPLENDTFTLAKSNIEIEPATRSLQCRHIFVTTHVSISWCPNPVSSAQVPTIWSAVYSMNQLLITGTLMRFAPLHACAFLCLRLQASPMALYLLTSAVSAGPLSTLTGALSFSLFNDKTKLHFHLCILALSKWNNYWEVGFISSSHV